MPDTVEDDAPRNLHISGSRDAHGEAALLLVESLIHGLVAHSHLSLSTAVDIVQKATDVQITLCEERGKHPVFTPNPVNLLSIIGQSLALDLKQSLDTKEKPSDLDAG